MSQLNGIYVDINGNVKCRLGDSGSIHITDIPTDDDYKLSFSVYDAVNKNILNEVSVQTNNAAEADVPLNTSFTTSLGIGRFFYGIKLTDSDGQEQTVSPNPVEYDDGNIAIMNPHTFVVSPLLTEGETNPINPSTQSGYISFAVVATYADLDSLTELELANNAVAKVLTDSTHSGAQSYYRWDRTNQIFTYLTSEGPYTTEAYVAAAVAGKQDTLTAGAGISITDNTISVAGFNTKLDKTGGVMTGNLKIDDASLVLSGNSDFELKSDASVNKMSILSGSKGLVITGTGNSPYYTDGANQYRLLNTDDITNGNMNYLRTWGNITGTIADQTDLKTYIQSVVGEMNMLGRMDYTNAVVTFFSNSSPYTCPSDGYVIFGNIRGTTTEGVITINSKDCSVIFGGVLPVSTGDILSQAAGYTATGITFVPQL